MIGGDVMPRPPCCRRISGKPAAAVFKPAGIPARKLNEIILALDEFEVIRLSDMQGFYQEEAAERMGISRPTFGRIINSAHRKIAEALATGKALKIDGGPVYAEQHRALHCRACEQEWNEYAGGSVDCPRCHSKNVVEESNLACWARRRKNWK
jgi:uncharacterized protein